MFFYLKTGGGHLAPAKAIAGKLKTKSRGALEILLTDGLSEAKPFMRRVLEDGYRTAVNKAVWTFEFLYAINKFSLISKITAAFVSVFIRRGVERQILFTRPDKIVIFHFFLIKPVSDTLKKHCLKIPVLTVVTDPFTAPPIWFLQKDQKYIVFSEMLRERCIVNGIDGDRIRVFPFVLSTKFSSRMGSTSRFRIRAELGFEPHSRIILIIGGGDGIPNGKSLLKGILAGNLDAEIAVVCGNNRKIFRYFNDMKERSGLKKLKVYGYIDFVHSLLSVSDVVITKCGASTIMEILLAGKVPLINNFIWEQEKGNMEFVCNGNMGILEKKTKRVPAVVNRLFSDEALYGSLRKNIRKASIRNGVGPVAEYIRSFN